MTRNHWEELSRWALGGGGGVQNLPGNLRVEAKEGRMVITRPHGET